jgi:hypothetical protein
MDGDERYDPNSSPSPGDGGFPTSAQNIRIENIHTE